MRHNRTALLTVATGHVTLRECNVAEASAECAAYDNGLGLLRIAADGGI